MPQIQSNTNIHWSTNEWLPSGRRRERTDLVTALRYTVRDPTTVFAVLGTDLGTEQREIDVIKRDRLQQAGRAQRP
jgi:hypothetical protein